MNAQLGRSSPLLLDFDMGTGGTFCESSHGNIVPPVESADKSVALHIGLVP